MLTTRGWWFFLVVLTSLGIAVAARIPGLSLVCLTLLLWFLGAWLAFLVRLRLLRLRLERRLEDHRGPVDNLWAKQSCRVHVKLLSDGGVSLPWVRVFDRVPVQAALEADKNYASGTVGPGQPLAFSYSLTCPASGRIRFEGLALQAADLQGFFIHALFVHAPAEYRVLPALADARGHVPAVKRFNLIPLFGVHRHPRPGSGSELFNLRDYLPGDPPKTIAWKASARRDRLITKEFEGEVPIRCTLFLDASQAVRLGPLGRNALARLVEIVAALAQANAGIRDLTGLCVFDEDRVLRWIRPARGSGHVVKLLNVLAEVADLPPHTAAVALEQLLPVAYGLALEVYPSFLERDVNAFPWWLPFWSPHPAYTIPRPPARTGSWWRRLTGFLAGRRRSLWLWLRQTVIARASPRGRRRYLWRKRLAALLSVRYHLDPGGLAMLLEDDILCTDYLQRFLAEHRVPYPAPLYDPQGHYLFASTGKLEVLAKALLQAIARGHDNELFVLLVDLLEAGPHVHAVLRAVKVALARHHQVLVVCPWPPGIPLPSDRIPAEGPTAGAKRERATDAEILLRGTTLRLHEAFVHLKTAFARLGVQVLCAPEEQAVALILERLHHLRQLERGLR